MLHFAFGRYASADLRRDRAVAVAATVASLGTALAYVDAELFERADFVLAALKATSLPA